MTTVISNRLELYATPYVLAKMMLETDPIRVGEWQALDVSASRAHDTYELEDVSIRFSHQLNIEDVSIMEGVNASWAEEHFQERVSGIPYNPAPSHVRWPWSRHNATHQEGEQEVFSHTYPERFWPKWAGLPVAYENIKSEIGRETIAHRGIRFEYGDLMDVVNLLKRSPYTRQAYVPIWFPEDTGAVHGKRVPCTLGYHFLYRDKRLSMRYYIRSCDLVRHFSDDIYMALLLQRWMVNMIDSEQAPCMRGDMTMHIGSLHAFRGDTHKLKALAKRGSDDGPDYS